MVALAAALGVASAAAESPLPPGYGSAQVRGRTVVFIRPPATGAARDRAATEIALHACAREAEARLAPEVSVLELSAPTEMRAVGAHGEPLPARVLVNGSFHGVVFFWDARKPDVLEGRPDCVGVLARAAEYFRAADAAGGRAR